MLDRKKLIDIGIVIGRIIGVYYNTGGSNNDYFIASNDFYW